ncbi:hypothetical protein [Paenibacillus sp. J2TS4]|uniref:hypothetical protein n=1 Tax=Paenibacillus sp. J2TS4 TaxID=2807194 RepID=UPI001B16AE16|nr:hypothetical protein [Paenibacillus sp. J2TS4]GIP33295.1 hypothetical protein J2TS4_25050 [Paenibacillus sp. J2TS4]
MKRISSACLSMLFTLSLFATAAMAAVPDFEQLGFPTVAAEQTIEAGQAATISYGSVKIEIPEGTFANSVKFQVLEGPLADFQAKAPEGETVLIDFAFKVTDTTTNELIGKFNTPVTFSFTSPSIGEESKYYDTAEDGTFTLNKVPAKIEGNTLSHPIAGAPVGWAVTSPAVSVDKATSPVTGINLYPWAAVGIIFLLAGAFVYFLSRRHAAN